MAQEATGLLIIRARLEAGSSQPLRVHLSITTDVSRGIEHERNLADVDAVCGAVEDWLGVMVAG